MREIDFRGWDVRNGCWVYGYYERLSVGMGPDREVIHKWCDWGLSMAHQIYPDSVGQYTGLKDMNDKRVYEGDILRWAEWEEELTDIPDVYIMSWDQKLGCWYLQCWRDGKEITESSLDDRAWDGKSVLHDMEVIGTTFERDHVTKKEPEGS